MLLTVTAKVLVGQAPSLRRALSPPGRACKSLRPQPSPHAKSPAAPKVIAIAILFCVCCLAQNTTTDNTLREAVRLHQSGNYAAAIAAYQQFLKVHPDAVVVRSNLGAALAHEGRFTEAVREYKLALAAMPQNQGIRFNLALAWYKSGDLRHAIEEFETIRSALPASDPQIRRATLIEAECWLREGHEKRAIELLDPIAASDPGDLAAAYLLGTALIRDNQDQAGARMIQRILGAGDTAEAHMLMAYTRTKMNDRKAAMAEVTRAIELNPSLPEAHTLHGRLLYINSDIDGAEAAFRRALVIDPNSFESLLFLGTLLGEKASFPEARKLLARALQLQPGELRARYQYAVLDMAEEKNASAAAGLESLVHDAPGFEEAHRSLSTVYFRLGRAADGRRERQLAENLSAQTDAKDQAFGRTLK